MMNSLSPNVPLFCVENMSAFLNDFGEPGMAHVVGGVEKKGSPSAAGYGSQLRQALIIISWQNAGTG